MRPEPESLLDDYEHTIMKYMEPLSHEPVQTAQGDLCHDCIVCLSEIEPGEQYRDAGEYNCAHERCYRDLISRWCHEVKAVMSN